MKYDYKMSVIMPSYNNGQFMRAALDSILMQKVNFDYQIIITDDASTDNSISIIKEYEEKYPDKITTLYSDKNQRLFLNVLKALEIMKSEYFCVLDPDDYYIDDCFWKNGIDFLDSHNDYTIYATNIYVKYNDDTIEPKYRLSDDLISKTSTYEDYLKGKAQMSCTPPSIYRNIYFYPNVPKEYINLKNSIFMESFRADTARNLIHLRHGKIFFENKFTSVCRYHGKGLASSLLWHQKYIANAFAMIGFYEFFGYENKDAYGRIIEKSYKMALKYFYQANVSEDNIIPMHQKDMEKFDYVAKWLIQEKIPITKRIVPFDLCQYKRIFTEKVAIWGTGSATQKMIEQYGLILKEDSFFIDNNSEKWNTLFIGHKVYSPEELLNHEGIPVVLMSSFHQEIIKQILHEKLCSLNNVIDLYDYRENWV